MKLTDAYLSMKRIIDDGMKKGKSVLLIKKDVVDLINELYSKNSLDEHSIKILSKLFECIDDIYMKLMSVDEAFIRILNDEEHKGYDMFPSNKEETTDKLNVQNIDRYNTYYNGPIRGRFNNNGVLK